ncbi:MAG: hypothetical protein ACI8X5_003174 [Planctomycetota bacterium]|jgi:hypothetical protein
MKLKKFVACSSKKCFTLVAGGILTFCMVGSKSVVATTTVPCVVHTFGGFVVPPSFHVTAAGTKMRGPDATLAANNPPPP